MKKKQKFLRLSTILLLLVTLCLSALSVQASVNSGRKTVSVAPLDYPGAYRVYSTLSSDNSQITLYLYFETAYPFSMIPAPAPTDLFVSLEVAQPGNSGTATVTAPFFSGYTTVTYSTGLWSSMEGYTYRITGVSPGYANSYNIYFDPTIKDLN